MTGLSHVALCCQASAHRTAYSCRGVLRRSSCQQVCSDCSACRKPFPARARIVLAACAWDGAHARPSSRRSEASGERAGQGAAAGTGRRRRHAALPCPVRELLPPWPTTCRASALPGAPPALCRVSPRAPPPQTSPARARRSYHCTRFPFAPLLAAAQPLEVLDFGSAMDDCACAGSHVGCCPPCPTF